MLREEKERIVTELADQLSSTETLIVADYRGLSNKQLEALRDELLAHGARFRIVKNSLTRRAADRAGADALPVVLEGPTAIAFIQSGGDPAAVAKALASTAKETNVLTLRGGILEGKALSRDEVDQLAKLPPADVLRGQLVATMASPLTILARGLGSMISGLAIALGQVREQGSAVAVEPELEKPEASRAETQSDKTSDAGPEVEHPVEQKEVE